eukprot:13655841-Heterocapsa_arctica.AAC.1
MDTVQDIHRIACPTQRTWFLNVCNVFCDSWNRRFKAIPSKSYPRFRLYDGAGRAFQCPPRRHWRGGKLFAIECF